jgi:ParB-like chromosome segregation protein Spo0J
MNILNQEIRNVPLAEIQEHPNNARKGDMGAIQDSVDENGFWGTIVVQKSTGFIVAGNHRYRAAKEAGFKEVPVAFVDVDDTKAKKILAADNRTSDLGDYDNEALARLLGDLKADEALDGIGYSSEDIALILDGVKSVTDDDWGAAFAGLPIGDRAPIQTMTFTLHDAQVEVVKEAVKRARADKDEETGNKNRNGNALAAICSAFLRATEANDG